MRLVAIQLQGFKSFCERTSVPVREGLTGVVGPNGCGKSNIVDALRWGLGESRAAQLRGGALQDVLFNGSGSRPPGDWCSVETKFLINEGEDLGMWSGCPEIVVKRELARDGQSYFYVNGQAARRRDVVSLFRGTGVSPRSYGVVEQGMVGSIAEASADELRQFLEETAGVSHYKDRRRDAERRLASCRANLEQLAQLMEESRKRQESLKRQARAARRHRELSDSINDLEVVLILQKRAHAEAGLAEKDRELATLQETTGALQSKCDSLREQIEEARKQREHWQKESQTHQTAWARAKDAADRIRRDSEQAESKRVLLHERIAAEKAELSEAQTAAKQCQTEDENTRRELHSLAEQVEKRSEETGKRTSEAESAQVQLQTAEAEMEAARRKVNELQQQQAARQIQSRMSEERRDALSIRRDKLRAGLDEIAKNETPPPSADQAQAKVQDAESAHDRARKESDVAAARAEQSREALREAENAHIAAEAARDALREMHEEGGEWKTDDIPPRLASVLQAEAGEWSRALDAALGRFAAGYAVPSLDDFLQANGMPPPGAGVAEMNVAPEQSAARDGWTTLLSQVRAPSSASAFLSVWLRGAYIVEDVDAARRLRGELSSGEMLLLKDGAVFTKNSVFVAGEVRGGFDWRRRLAALDSELGEFARKLEQARSAADESVRARDAAFAARDASSAKLQNARAELSDLRIEVGQWEERQRAATERKAEMESELESASEELKKLNSALSTQIEDADSKKDHDAAAAEFAAAKSRADAAAEELESRRAALQNSEMTARELDLRRENLTSQTSALQARGEELARRQKTLATQIAQTESEIAQFAENALGDALKSHSSDIAAAEAELQKTAAKEKEWTDKVAAADSEREQRLQELQTARESGTALQVQKRELSLSVEGLVNSLEEFEQDEERLAPLKSDGVSAEERKEEIASLRLKRDRLGAINFAASQELSEGETRLEEMQAQQTDVESAADELQKTIRRIDDETRTRLRDVYEAINREFAGLFRRLFGGGEAELSMRGDSFLESEFEIRARPPGKRMFPVRMLSGGEKTATALAFIFTLMRHTPPPFCIMDEVDATLDDSRADSFISLLREMSEHFQCIVVTHNKSTIEAAHNLIGVTQEEKGVSKVVTVTRAEAARAATS